VLAGKPEHLARSDVAEALEAFVGESGRVSRATLAERDTVPKPPDDADAVLAVGGDGTVREAAALAYARGLPLAILPLGTANDLARTLGIPLNVAAAADLLARGVRRRIDLGRCNGRIFCNVASVGLSARVAGRLTGDRKKRWGPLAYGREMFDALKTRRDFRVVLEFRDRSVRHTCIQFGVASGETQGGGNRVSPLARIDDGRFCIYAIERVSLSRLAAMALSVKLGAHDIWRNAHFYEADWLRLVTRRQRSIDIDGDLLERTPAEFELLAGAIEVLVPHDALPEVSEGSRT
jgi:YegS/Rv2252/BmrU family lipid kinase